MPDTTVKDPTVYNAQCIAERRAARDRAALSWAHDQYVALRQLNAAQRATVERLTRQYDALGEDEWVTVFKTTVAAGLTPMPPRVYTVRVTDITGDAVKHELGYLHPDGTLRYHYDPAALPSR
jgi:hypothetical protein